MRCRTDRHQQRARDLGCPCTADLRSAGIITVGLFALYAVFASASPPIFDPGDTFHQVLKGDLTHRPVMFGYIASAHALVALLTALSIPAAKAFSLHSAVWGAIGGGVFFLLLRALGFRRLRTYMAVGLLATSGAYWWQAEKGDLHAMWLALVMASVVLVMCERFIWAGIAAGFALCCYPLSLIAFPSIAFALFRKRAGARALGLFALCVIVPLGLLISLTYREYFWGRWGIVSAWHFAGGVADEASLDLADHFNTWLLMALRGGGIGWALLMVSLVLAVRRWRAPSARWWPLVGLSLGPLAMSLLSPFEEQAYLLGALPLLVAAASLALVAIGTRKHGRVALWMALAAHVAFAYVVVVGPGLHDLQDIREMAARSRERFGGTALYLCPYSLAAPFSVELARNHCPLPYPQCVWGEHCQRDTDTTARDLRERLAARDQVLWLYRDGRSDPLRDLVVALLGQSNERQPEAQMSERVKDCGDVSLRLQDSEGRLRLYEVESCSTE